MLQVNAAMRRAGRSRALLLPALLLLLVVAGCAHQPPAVLPGEPGFFSGLLHGFLILVSLVGSLFTDVRVYAFPNSGFFYDLGFFIGATSFLGGGASTARRRRA
jgi:hypothetical protein